MPSLLTATPEPEHLRAGAAPWRPKHQPQIFDQHAHDL